MSAGNAELPEDLRQKVFPTGVLRVERVQKVADAGLYTCVARNKQGHTARRGADVQVIGKAELAAPRARALQHCPRQYGPPATRGAF